MTEEDPFPDIPDCPRGLSLDQQRQWVSKHALPIHRWKIKQAKEAGFEWMRWLGVDERETCEHCRQTDRVIFSIAEMDADEHYAKCSCDNGCACCCVAVMGAE